MGISPPVHVHFFPSPTRPLPAPEAYPHVDPAHFGLRPLLAEYGSPEIDRIPQVELLEVLKRQIERDQAPHPMQVLALLDPGPLRKAALRCLQEFIQGELLPHLEPLATGATPQ